MQTTYEGQALIKEARDLVGETLRACERFAQEKDAQKAAEIVEEIRRLTMQRLAIEQSVQFAQAKRRQEEYQRQREQHEAEARAAKESDRLLKEGHVQAKRVRALEAYKKKAEAELLEAEIMAIEGRKQALAQWALANGVLEPVSEERLEAIVNAQRRSSGSIVRIESGDGK